MKFYKIYKKCHRPFFLVKVKIENVNQFAFLGVTGNAACSLKPCLKDLGSKATRALFAVNSRYKLHKLPVHMALELSDSLTVPILLYGCEIWGPYEDHNSMTWDKTDTNSFLNDYWVSMFQPQMS